MGISLNGTELRICDVGYGVSQSLPIVVDIFARSASYWYAIQQPEVHLHPKAQAALGDLICQMAEEEKKKFFIETHSDYLIDRFRLRYGAAELDNLECQTLFFERHKTGNRVTPIDILPNGDYSDDQPAAFRDFFIKEQMALLGL